MIRSRTSAQSWNLTCTAIVGGCSTGVGFGVIVTTCSLRRPAASVAPPDLGPILGEVDGEAAAGVELDGVAVGGE